VNAIPRIAARGNATRRPRPSRHSLIGTHSFGVGRATLVAAFGIVVGGLTLGTTMAQPRAAVDRSTAVDAGASGTIQLVDRGRLAPGLAEVRIGFATGASPASGANRLLALSPDGTTAAVASQIGPGPAVLTLAGLDSHRQRISMPGLIGAGFAPDGSWLAAVDGSGTIWRVARSGAAASQLADGPFIGTPIVEPGGAVLALRVSSIEAPIVSQLVRISPDGDIERLVDDELVYGAQRMDDGSIAYAAHRGSRTYLVQLAGGGSRQLADLGEDAVNAVLSPAQDAVAFERSGQVFLERLGDHGVVPLGVGTRPQFAPDGHSVLVELASGSALLAIDGQRLATFGSQSAFAACAAECRP
jgi:hypothetical protein